MKFNIRYNPGDYININGWYYLVYSRADGFIHAVFPGYRPAPLMQGNPLATNKGKPADCSMPTVPVGINLGDSMRIPSTWRLRPDSHKIIFKG